LGLNYSVIEERARERQGLDETDHKPVSLQDFEDALKSILLKLTLKKFRWENREPTVKELSTGFKLKCQK